MPIGKKQIFLPNFQIGLLRSSHLPPNYAHFIVPLNFNKLDLKDYLLHAYNLKCLSIRSYVVQQKVQRIKDLRIQRREPYRPQAIKKMTVEMEEPFLYPDPPEDLSPWDHDLFNAGRKAQEKRQQLYSAENMGKIPDHSDRNHLFEVARHLLRLEEEEPMEEVEVEKDKIQTIATFGSRKAGFTIGRYKR